jgi:hypothetical protein
MNVEVMDPSLELQQLASQALQSVQYQNTHIADFPPPSPSALSGGSESKSGDTEPKFPCPFPRCNRHYKRKDLLKRHLTTLLASQDENHRDDEEWKRVKETGVMTIYTRPRNLTEEQKKLRRKESNLRHRIKYAQELKEKRNRKRRVEKLLEGKQVGVQTPDWEEEARAQAAMNAALNDALNTATRMDSAQEFVAELGNTEPPPNRVRRGGKKTAVLG